MIKVEVPHDGSILDKAREAVAFAKSRSLRIVIVESCTGGALTTLLSDIEGAGDVLEGGFVSYAKSFKSEVLGVSKELLHIQSAVSRDVVSAMAIGALDRSPNSDVAIAVTGVCGPEEDEDGNPVGLAWIALHDRRAYEKCVQLRLAPDTLGHLRGEMMRGLLSLLEAYLRNRNDEIDVN